VLRFCREAALLGEACALDGKLVDARKIVDFVAYLNQNKDPIQPLLGSTRLHTVAFVIPPGREARERFRERLTCESPVW